MRGGLRGTLVSHSPQDRTGLCSSNTLLSLLGKELLLQRGAGRVETYKGGVNGDRRRLGFTRNTVYR